MLIAHLPVSFADLYEYEPYPMIYPFSLGLLYPIKLLCQCYHRKMQRCLLGDAIHDQLDSLYICNIFKVM